jgi:hypothetical protein
MNVEQRSTPRIKPFVMIIVTVPITVTGSAVMIKRDARTGNLPTAGSYRLVDKYMRQPPPLGSGVRLSG